MQGVPHQIVHIDLSQKPAWFLELCQKEAFEETVPIIDFQGTATAGGTDLCWYSTPTKDSRTQFALRAIANDRLAFNNCKFVLQNCQYMVPIPCNHCTFSNVQPIAGSHHFSIILVTKQQNVSWQTLGLYTGGYVAPSQGGSILSYVSATFKTYSRCTH